MPKKLLPILWFVLLIAGLFWSRALLSLTSGAWLIFSLFRLKKNPIPYRDPILIWCCIPLLIWVAGVWQDPLAAANWDYALSLAAYPATYIIIRTTDLTIVYRQWIWIWMLATILGVSYPLFHFFLDYKGSVGLYGTGRSLPTFMDTDHVRFSIFLCSSFLFLMLSVWQNRKQKWIALGLLAGIILFLAVRTGWVLLAVLLFLYGCWQCKSGIRKLATDTRWKYLIATLTIIGIFLLALLLPTVQQKIAYSRWEWKQYQQGVYPINHSDGVRRAVNDAAWISIQDGSGSNKGWAGIPMALQKSFSQKYGSAKLEFGWPFNQWLFWWMGAGWWGMLLFSGWLLFPAIEGWRKNKFGIFAWSICIAVSCLAETTLNYQYGIFLHLWPLLLFWNKPICSESGNS